MPLATAQQRPLGPPEAAARVRLGPRKLSVRLLLLVLLALLPVFAVQIHHELKQRESRRAEVAQQVQQMAGLVAGQLDRVIEGAEILMATLGEVPAIRFRSEETCRQMLIGLALRFDHLHLIRVTSPDGTVFCASSAEEEGINIASRPYFQRVLRDKAPVVSELMRRQPDGRQVIAIAQPTLDANDQVETVIMLLLEPGRLSDLLAQVSLPEDAVLGVLDRRGHLAAGVPYSAERIGEPMADEGSASTLFGPEQGRVARESDDGVRRFYGFARSSEAPDLVVYVGLAEGPVFAEADRLFLRQAILSGSAFLLAAVAAFWFADYAVRRPLMRLKAAINRVAAGDLSARADLDSGIQEFAELAASFDDMAAKRRHAEVQQHVIQRELNHRMKNSLAAVRSIATQTLGHSASPEEFQRAFEGRIAALARASSLLTDNWRATDLRALVEAVVEPYRTDANVRLNGAPVQLPSKVALTLSMALHELATNAAKYGALSTAQGRVDIDWDVEEPTGSARLVLDWSEKGGPPVTTPERRGFGRTLIEASVEYELDGRVSLEFRPGGVQCRIAIPLPADEALAA